MLEDVSGWHTRLSESLIQENTASGIWRNKTLVDLLEDQISKNPNQLLVIDKDVSINAGELSLKANRLAAAFQEKGLVAGDVISFQLPNWNESLIIDVAASILGLVSNPIIPIYRDAEVSYILKNAGTKLIFIPTEFRNFDYLSMIEANISEYPDLSHIITVRGSVEGYSSYEDLLLEGLAASLERPKVDPNAVKLIMYTSGTTGKPKGVLHSHNTIDTENQAFSKFLGLGCDDIILMPSPLTHITGYLYGIQLPIVLGIPVVLMENWNAKSAAELINQHEVTFTIAATVFLQELTEFSENNKLALASLRYFPCGGAPVPPEIIYNAHEVFEQCVCARCYGSTEAPTVTLGVNTRQQEELGATTEGFIVGHEIKIVDERGLPVASGIEGEIITRGPEMCIGYADEAHNNVFDEKGFFHTGDLGVLTVEGCLVITGRLKDLIIRGGENLSPREVEDALHEHSAIYEAAVVAMPHERLGETGCAFVILNQNAALSFDEMILSLEKTGMAKQKYPERLVVVEKFPRTPAGKIRKNVLREIIRIKIEEEVETLN